MVNNTSPDHLSAIRRPVLTLGGILVLLGAVLLLFLGAMVWLVITAPQEVAIVQFVLEHVRAGDTAIYGTMKDPQTLQNINFELNWTESVRTISFLFLGVAILGVLAGIAKILISSGVSLITLVTPRDCKDVK